MGETDNVQQGVQTSGGQDGSTSEQETPTFTRKQADALAGKARSDALAEVGRLKKAAEDASRVAQSAIQRLQKYEDDRLRAEEDAARDDPAKLSALQMRRQAMQKAAEVEADRQSIETERAEIKTQHQEILEHRAERLSEKYNVDSSIILKYGGNSRDSMEELAKSYGERTAQAGESGQQNTQRRMLTAPDSGKTKGGGGSLTKEQIKNMSPEEQNRRQSELAKMSFGSS